MEKKYKKVIDALDYLGILTVPAYIYAGIRSFLFAFLATHIIFVSNYTARVLVDRHKWDQLEGINLWIYIAILFLSILLLLVYVYFRDVHKRIRIIVKSRRFDILVYCFFGIFVAWVFRGYIETFYDSFIQDLSDYEFISIGLIPLVVILGVGIRGYMMFRHKSEMQEIVPLFVTDDEKSTSKDDLLDLYGEAERFAAHVYNNGHASSMVFGLDAPWGFGKSSFINFCKEIWRKKHGDSIIVYSFSPLQYANENNILVTFIDGLIRVLAKKTFIPEARSLISRYSRFIAAKYNFSFFGIKFIRGEYTIDDAFSDLKFILSKIEQKVVVVIDDLDRLDFVEVKQVLYAIKKSFHLPNISYVLCYDTENIVSFSNKDTEAEKVIEFLEKFVNIKVNIFLDSDTLQKYTSENLSNALAENIFADPILISQALSGLKEIYRSPDYLSYLSYIGDIRKIKRLINTLLVLEIEKTNFDQSDILSSDLIHLLLIYINYPNIFRDIYNSETGDDRRGPFSARAPYEVDYPESEGEKKHELRNSSSPYKNSEAYEAYTKRKQLTEKQLFLLNKVFDVESRLKNKSVDDVVPEAKHMYACFNGGDVTGTGRNLEAYLKLIGKSSQPKTEDQYAFYLNCIKRFLNGVAIEDIFSDDVFDKSKGEQPHELFWRAVINNSRKIKQNDAARLIQYLAKNISDYSLLRAPTTFDGFRKNSVFFIIKLLDSSIWVEGDIEHSNNIDENIAQIADWIFGDNTQKGNGIIDILGNEDQGVLGLNDLLTFRLFSSADRGGDYYNLQRSLLMHAGLSTNQEGSIQDYAIQELREMTQIIFKIFDQRYIQSKRNLFDDIDGLSIDDFSGGFSSSIKQEIQNNESIDIEQITHVLRSQVKGYMLYQLCSFKKEHGIGCGHYDEEGDVDDKGIHKKMNTYLFEVCFDPESEKGMKHFVDYLLIQYISAKRDITGDGIVTLAAFDKVFDAEKLSNYWQNNKESIIEMVNNNQGRTVYLYENSADYSQIDEVFTLLDSLGDK